MGFHEQVKTYPSNYTYGFKDVLLLLLQLRKFVGRYVFGLFVHAKAAGEIRRNLLST